MSMLVPGLGQLYCAFGMERDRPKQYIKCFIILTLFVLTVMTFFTAIIALVLWIFNVIDAIQTARLVAENRYVWRPLVLSAKEK